MKREVRLLQSKAVDSLSVCIDHFNNSSTVARTEAVLIFLDHSFEMLLKASILHRRGRIRDPGEANTIGFDQCVRRAVSSPRLAFISEDQALVLQAINGLRDAAQHYLVELSEPQLYFHAQSGVTLFRDLLRDVFEQELAEFLPDRVLPISTIALTDPITMFSDELAEVGRLLAPGRRRGAEALARLRGLAVVDAAIQGQKLQPSDSDLRAVGAKVASGAELADAFPGITSVSFTTEGDGARINLRITKKEGVPVHLVPEGTENASVVAVRKVNELGFYNLRHAQISRHVDMSPNKTTAAIRLLGLKGDPDCHRELVTGKSKFDLYSQEALRRVQQLLDELGSEEIWRRYKEVQSSEE